MCFCANLSPLDNLSEEASCHNCKLGKEQETGFWEERGGELDFSH